MHSGGVSRGRFCGCDFLVLMLLSAQHMLQDSVFALWGILAFLFKLLTVHPRYTLLKPCGLEDTARFASFHLAPAEGFGLGPRLYFPFGQKKAFSVVLAYFCSFLVSKKSKKKFVIKKKISFTKDTVRYAGLLIAPAEGFGLRLRLFLPFGQKKELIMLFCKFL